jgi:hypothetical protein
MHLLWSDCSIYSFLILIFLLKRFGDLVGVLKEGRNVVQQVAFQFNEILLHFSDMLPDDILPGQ